jgi:type II secretion system (T2SS) protein E
MSVLDKIIPPTPDAEPLRWHLRAEERQALKALRCYCLRLGTTIQVNPDGSLEVSLRAGDTEDLAPYFLSWGSTNGVRVDVRARTPEKAHAATAPVAVAVAPEPAPATEPEPAREPEAEPEHPAQQATVHALPVSFDPDRPRLGDLLVMKGLIDRDQLVSALAESKRTGVMLGRVLIAKQWIFEEELARMLSVQWDIPYVSLSRLGVDQGIARLLPRDVGVQAAAIPVRRRGDGAVVVAFADPTDENSFAAVTEYIPHFAPVVAELTDITMSLRALPA